MRTKFVMAGIMALAITGAVAPVAHADATNGDIFYTTFTDQGGRLFTRSYSFDGTTLTYGSDTTISGSAQGLNGADGVVFDPTDPNFLLVGGQSNVVYRVNRSSGAVTTSSATTDADFHLTITPDAQNVLGTNIPGSSVAEVDLTPFGAVTTLTILGDDTTITGIAFDGAGNGFYTSSGPGGIGSFGTLTLGAGSVTTTRLASNIDAHGISFDAFSNSLILFGDDRISQYSLGGALIGDITAGEMTVLNDCLNVGIGPQFDQGAVDSKGHIFAASNNGCMAFVDYSATKDLDSAGFTDFRFFRADLDDVAPLSGLGSQQPVPEPSSLILLGLGGLGAGFVSRRKKA